MMSRHALDTQHTETSDGPQGKPTRTELRVWTSYDDEGSVNRRVALCVLENTAEADKEAHREGNGTATVS